MKPVNELTTPALAYLGDAVIELYVRGRLVAAGYSTSASLNQKSLDFVRAGAQAEAMQKILPLLTEEEQGVFRRGRNMGHGNVPKGATVAQYRAATGMEVLAGYLHVLGREQRLYELLDAGYAQNDI
jgi:ribonuclease-3 family protein